MESALSVIENGIIFQSDPYRWRSPENLACNFRFQSLHDFHQCKELILDIEEYYFENLENNGNLQIYTTYDEGDQVINKMICHVSITQSSTTSQFIECWNKETHQLHVTVPKRGRYKERWINHCLRSMKKESCYEKLKGNRRRKANELKQRELRWETEANERRRQFQEGCVIV